MDLQFYFLTDTKEWERSTVLVEWKDSFHYVLVIILSLQTVLHRQMFHLLRRQIVRPFRKPLVVFTPKKLLRYPKAVSKMSELANGKFIEVLDDPRMEKTTAVKKVDTVMLCTGKIYYEVLERFDEKKDTSNIAAIRIEQVHPFLKLRLIQSLENTVRM